MIFAAQRLISTRGYTFSFAMHLEVLMGSGKDHGLYHSF